MKILMVSSSILPQSGGSSVIVEQLAQNFTTDQMTVFGSSVWKPKNIPDRSKSGPEFKYFFSELNLMGRGARFFDWFRKMRFQPLVEEIKRTIKEEGISCVIGVYPNQFYCLAACRAARDTGIPFNSYFHNTYIENVAITDPNAEKWQQEIFDASDHIFVMSKGMEDFYESKYKLGKFIPLVHTFMEYPTADKLTGIPGEGKKQYKLVAIGNFNESNLDATRRLLAAIEDNPKYSLSVYTHVPKLLLEKRGLDTSRFEHRGSVLPEEVHGAIQDFDICLLPHGFTGGYGEVEYKTIFPTRTIPLLLSGKPIFAHSPAGSFLNSFLEQHQCAELVNGTDENAIVAGLNKIADDANYQQTLVNKARLTAEGFYGPNVAAELINQLEKRL